MLNQKNLLTILQTTRNLRLLYIEDDEESLIQALKMFHNYFEFIDTAVNGEEGLEVYKNYHIETNSHYDLVITDIQMPKMNGVEMSKEIYEINNKQKIIAVSAYSDTKYFIDLINIGIDGFIQKPLSFEQTTDALSEFCKMFKEDYIITISDNYRYNIDLKNLYYDDEVINTTMNENKFIEFLIKNKNHHSTLEDIFNHIYYDEPERNFSVDSIKGLVKRLRKKLPLELILHSRTTGYSLIS